MARPEVTGQRGAWTIDGFCAAHGISRSFLYKLWKEGKGPKYIEVNSKRLITSEQRAKWVAARQAETTAA